MDTNFVIAIMATGAMIISTLSFIITMKFNKRQIEHNRNCLKPICSIGLTNYENFISVRIENNGMGPLIIKSIKCVNESTGESTDEGSLYKLLPEELQRKNFHRILIRLGMSSSISVNGKKYLLSISLEDEETRRLLRECLKDITVSVEYTDIYNSKFERVERKLTLFGLTNLKMRITDVEKFHLWS